MKRLVWEGEPGGREGWRRKWYGVTGFFEWLESRTYRMHVRVFLSRYRSYRQCHDCGGARLRAEARLFRVDGRALPELEALPVAEAERAFREWDGGAQGGSADAPTEQLLHEIRGRLRFLVDVGLGYLTLGRRRGRCRAARRSASRWRRRSAARSPARSTSSTSPRSACTRATPRVSPGCCGGSRSRKCGCGRRARSRADRVGRPRDRPRARSGPRGRRARVRGGGRGAPRRGALGDRRVPEGTSGNDGLHEPTKARFEAVAAHPGSQREQPEEPHAAPAARPPRLRNGGVRVGKVIARRPSGVPEPATAARARRSRARANATGSTAPTRSRA